MNFPAILTESGTTKLHLSIVRRVSLRSDVAVQPHGSRFGVFGVTTSFTPRGEYSV